MTADEFVALILPHVQVEAEFTEANNETREVLEYVADLHTRLGRVLAGELPLGVS